MPIKELEKLINKHSGNQRLELINTYRKEIDNLLENTKTVSSPHIHLISSAANFLPPSEKLQLLSKAVNAKVYQARTYILNHLDADFSLEKSHFSSFSPWATALVKETQDTFYLAGGDRPIDEEGAELFHKKMLEELGRIFCSNEKFNSAGNQLMIDLKKIMKNIKGAEKEKEELERKIRKNFHGGKGLSAEAIKEIYEAIEKGATKEKRAGKEKGATKDAIKDPTKEKGAIKDTTKEKGATASKDTTKDTTKDATKDPLTKDPTLNN